MTSPPYSLHGRTRELEAINNLWTSVQNGYLQICLIEGEAGIGKTAFLESALHQADEAGMNVFFTRADELGADIPFSTIAEVLGCRADSDDALRRLVGKELSGEVPDSGGLGLHYRLIDLLVDLLETEAVHRPTVIAIDDAQWADRATLRTMAATLGRLATVPLAFTVAYRADRGSLNLRAFLERAREHGAMHLELGPLDRTSSRRILEDALGKDLPASLEPHIEGAAGYPYFLAELAAAVADPSMGARKDLGPEVARLPDSFHEAIIGRLKTLPGDEWTVLRVAAVIGRSFQMSDLAAVMDRSIVDLISILDRLMQAGVIEGSEDSLRFRHGLTREAIYEDLDPSTRIALHGEIGRALGRAGAAAPSVAHHLAIEARPGDPEVIGWLRRAADEVAARDPSSASAFLRRASELAIDEVVGAQIRADLAVLLAFSGDPREAEDLVRSALSTSKDVAYSERLIPALVQSLFAQGRWQDVVEEVGSALTTHSLPEQVTGRLLAESALARIWTGDTEGAVTDAETAVAVGKRSEDPVAICFGLGHLSVLADIRGDFQQGVALAQRAVEVARRGVSEVDRRHPQIALGMALVAADRLHEAKVALQEGRRTGERLGTAWDLPLYHAMLALPHFYLGEWDAAVAEAEAGVTFSAEVGSGVGMVTALSLMASIATARGNFDEAGLLIEQADDIVARSGPQWGMVWLALATATYQGALGNAGIANDILSGTWAHASATENEETKLRVGPPLVRSAIKAGDKKFAASIAMDVGRAARAAGVPFASGAALVTSGLVEVDPEAVERGVEAYRTAGRLPEAAAAGKDAAEMWASSGRMSEARAAFTDCVTILDNLEAEHDLARLSASMRSLGLRAGARGTRKRPSSGWDSLTPTELKVVKLAAEGLTNPQIGERLFISRRTVHAHLSHVFQKLGLSSRVELASHVAQRDL